MKPAPIFESTTSALYYSNDGRLHLVIDRNHDEVALSRTAYALVLVPDVATVELAHGVEVFRTFDRQKADAYIAGYDLAREN